MNDDGVMISPSTTDPKYVLLHGPVGGDTAEHPVTTMKQLDSVPLCSLLGNPVKSIGSGPWSSPATWEGNSVPEDGDYVSIEQGTIVTIDTLDAKARCVQIQYGNGGVPGGALQFKTDAATRLTVDTIIVMPRVTGTAGDVHPEGTLIVDASEGKFSPGIRADIVIRDRPLDTGTLDVPGPDPGQYWHGIVGFGKVRMNGRPLQRTFVQVANELRAGDRVIALSEPVTDWTPGDELSFPETRQIDQTPGYTDWTEPADIESVSADGKTITLKTPLLHDHLGAHDVDGTLTRVTFENGQAVTLLPHVANLTRNIVIRSENPSGTRGHVMFSGRADVDVRYARFKDLGRTTTETIDNTKFDAGGRLIHIGANQVGRYAFHFHHTYGPLNPGHVSRFQVNVRGNTIDHTKRWGFVLHRTSDVDAEDNVIAFTDGAAFNGDENANNVRMRIVRNYMSEAGLAHRGESGFHDHNRGGGLSLAQMSCFWAMSGLGRDSVFARNVMNNCGHQGYTIDNTPTTTGTHISNNPPDSGLFDLAGSSVFIPKFPGANQMDRDQSELFHTGADAFASEDNMVYATSRVMECWGVNVDPNTPLVIRRLAGWHIGKGNLQPNPFTSIQDDGAAIINSSCAAMRFDDLVLRNDRAKMKGMAFFFYNPIPVVDIIRANVQGFDTFLFDKNVSYATDRTEINIVGGELGNRREIAIYDDNDTVSGPEVITVRDTRFLPLPAPILPPEQRLYFWLNPDLKRDKLIFPFDVEVQNVRFGNAAPVTARIYHDNQKPGALLQRSFTFGFPGAPHGETLVGCPVGTMTNAECNERYGAMWGDAGAPCDTTMPGISGGVICSGPPIHPKTVQDGLPLRIYAYLNTFVTNDRGINYINGSYQVPHGVQDEGAAGICARVDDRPARYQVDTDLAGQWNVFSPDDENVHTVTVYMKSHDLTCDEAVGHERGSMTITFQIKDGQVRVLDDGLPYDCRDQLDNDGDGKKDAADPGCHDDGDAANAGSYTPLADDETDRQVTQCNDWKDNDADQRIDVEDNQCHAARDDGNGLLARWKFDETSGTSTANDRGDSYTIRAQFTGGVRWTQGNPLLAGNHSAALLPGGDGEVIDTGQADRYGFDGKSFTVSMFFKASGENQGYRSIIGNSGGLGQRNGWNIGLDPAHPTQFNCSARGTSGQAYTSVNDPRPPLLNDQWNHIACVFARSGDSITATAYLNGIAISSDTAAVGSIASDPDDPQSALVLGRNRFAADDVRLYDRALTAAEVAALSGGDDVNGAVGHWAFDEGQGMQSANAIPDTAGSTLKHGTARTTGTPLLTPNAGALEFDGADDDVRIAGGKQAYNFGKDDFTVSLFLRTDVDDKDQSILGTYVERTVPAYPYFENSGWGLHLYKYGSLVFFAYADAYGKYGIDANNFRSPVTPVNDGKWHHVAATFRRVGDNRDGLTITTYVDGKYLIARTTHPGDISANSALLLGKLLLRRPDNNSGRNFSDAHPFQGSMDDLRIYSRALSGEEILALSTGTYDRTIERENPLPPPPPALCADTLDNDGDGKADAQDEACHTDGDVSNAASYDPARTSEQTPAAYEGQMAGTEDALYGATFAHKLTVHNAGEQDGTPLAVDDTLPEGVTLVQDEQNLFVEGGSCDAAQNGASFRCTATLPGNGWFSVTALVRAATPASCTRRDVTDTATVRGAAEPIHYSFTHHIHCPTVVTNVTSPVANGTYGAGASIPVQIIFSQPVTVTGIPRLTLETGTSDAVLSYASGNGTDTLTFTYTVAQGHSSADLEYVSASALALNGGTIKTAVGHDAVLILPAPGSSGSLGANKAIVISTTAGNAALREGNNLYDDGDASYTEAGSGWGPGATTAFRGDSRTARASSRSVTATYVSGPADITLACNLLVSRPASDKAWLALYTVKIGTRPVLLVSADQRREQTGVGQRIEGRLFKLMSVRRFTVSRGERLSLQVSGVMPLGQDLLTDGVNISCVRS